MISLAVHSFDIYDCSLFESTLLVYLFCKFCNFVANKLVIIYNFLNHIQDPTIQVRSRGGLEATASPNCALSHQILMNGHLHATWA